MKKNTSSPYRTLNLKKIDAPHKLTKDEPKSNTVKSEQDFRVGGKR